MNINSIVHRQNILVIISLLVAISSLAYTSWRNERSEANRNIRDAGFELIRELSALEKVVWLAHYDKDELGGNPRIGWTHVLAIRDLAELTSPQTLVEAEALQNAWQANWQQLGQAQESADEIEARIDAARAETLVRLRALN